MAVTELVRRCRAATSALGLLDFGSVEQRRNDCGRPDPNRNAGLHKLSPPFIVPLVVVAHSNLTRHAVAFPYAQASRLKSGEVARCAVG